MPFRSVVLPFAFLLACPETCVTARAQPAPDDAPARAALRALADSYARIESIELELIPAQEAPSRSPLPRTRIVVHRDARFAYEEFEPATSPHPPRAPGVPLRDAAGNATGEELRYFVFHDLTSLFTTDGDAGLYFKSSVTAPEISLPPRPQYDLAPWPVVPAIVEHMLAHPHTTFARDAHTWSARTSLDRQRSFEVAWTDLPDLGPVLTRIERTTPDARFTTTFENYSSTGGFSLPSQRSDHASFLQAGQRRDSRSTRHIRVVAINPADIDRRILFQPASYAMRFVDAATGNVHSREGGPVLYNAHDLNAAFEREQAQASIFARSWFAGVLAAGAGSLALLWRKLRGRP